MITILDRKSNNNTVSASNTKYFSYDEYTKHTPGDKSNSDIVNSFICMQTNLYILNRVWFIDNHEFVIISDYSQ